MDNLVEIAQMAAYTAQVLAFFVLLLATLALTRGKLNEGCSPPVLLLFAICLTNAGFVVRGISPYFGVSMEVAQIASRVLFIAGALTVIRVALNWLGSSMWVAVTALAVIAAIAVTWPLQWWS